MTPSAGFAIVTGANCGLGLHLVKSLYAAGTYATIVLACRSEQRTLGALDEVGRWAKDTIMSKLDGTENSNGTAATLKFVKLDLSSKVSVRSFVDQLADQQLQKGTLQLLVNNAGTMGHPAQLVDGVEVHFASNHLGHFLLTNLLIEQNWLAPDARILLVTSGLYEKCRAMMSASDLTDPSLVAKHSAADFYSFSKLANCLHAIALAKRLSSGATAADGINGPCRGGAKVVAIRPGFVRGTELGRHTHFLLRMLAYPLIWMVAKNLDQGISSMVHCAHCDAAQLQNGALYYEGRTAPYGSLVTEAAADQLWELSEQMVQNKWGWTDK